MKIDNGEQYDAVIALNKLLLKFGNLSTNVLAYQIMDLYDFEFSVCADCHNRGANCTCNPEYSNDRYDIYDDEASFD